MLRAANNDEEISELINLAEFFFGKKRRNKRGTNKEIPLAPSLHLQKNTGMGAMGTIQLIVNSFVMFPMLKHAAAA